VATKVEQAPQVIRILLDPTSREVRPSVILNNPAKIDYLMSIFDPQGKLNQVVVNILKVPPLTVNTNQLLIKADLLFEMYHHRFRSHIKRRVKVSQQSHWCFSFAMTNLAVCAAWKVIVQHLKNDISCLDESECLLANPGDNQYLLCANVELTLFGCYLTHCTNKEVFIRSGSAMGDGGFGGRLKQHFNRAKSDRNIDNSRFYQWYPDSESVYAKSNMKDGLYGYLDVFVGIGFSNELVSIDLFSKDYDDGGVFIYTEEQKAAI